MSLQCIICGHEEQREIVTHINFAHNGGLHTYAMFFPFAKTVCPEIFKTIENERITGSAGQDIPELKNISREDRELILQIADNQRPVRSDITVEQDL